MNEFIKAVCHYFIEVNGLSIVNILGLRYKITVYEEGIG